jgi:hypothetical protein
MSFIILTPTQSPCYIAFLIAGTSRLLLPVDIVRVVESHLTFSLPKSATIERLRQEVLWEMKNKATAIFQL